MGERGTGEVVDLQASVSELQARVCRSQAHLQGARAVAATAAARQALAASYGCGGGGEGGGDEHNGRQLELDVELSPRLGRAASLAATGLGDNLTEPLDFMQGIKLPRLPEGGPDSPLRAFARFQQGLMTSPLYAGRREESVPAKPALGTSLSSPTAQQVQEARLESAKPLKSRGQVQFQESAAALDEQLMAAPSGPNQPARASGCGSCGGRGSTETEQRQLSRRAASSPSLTRLPPPSHSLLSPTPGDTAGWMRAAGLGTRAVADSSSRRQRNSYPMPVLLPPTPSCGVGSTPRARPSSDSQRKPTIAAAPTAKTAAAGAKAAALGAKAAAQTDAEDLWEDLCRTLREL